MPTAQRPYVICHMIPSVDGRIVTGGWKLPPRVEAEYERAARTFDADAWMIGRISMEPYAGRTRAVAADARAASRPVPRTDFAAQSDAESYAVALDPSGRLAWKSNAIDGEHVITILSEQVPDSYLRFLRSKGVSYLFGGRTEIDLRRVLNKLRREFGIRRLLLEGGGKINGSFLAADLIDELSILIAPVADGAVGTPTLFDAYERTGPARRLRLASIERRAGGLVWLRYRRPR